MNKLCLLLVLALLSHEALAEEPGQYPGQYLVVYPGQYPREYIDLYLQQYPGMYPVLYPGLYPGQYPGQVLIPNPGQFPVENPGQNQGQGQNTNPSTTTQAPSGVTTLSPAVLDCLRTCLRSFEYKPVCGSDNVTYNNPEHLKCAQGCGINVTQVKASPCSKPSKPQTKPLLINIVK